MKICRTLLLVLIVCSCQQQGIDPNATTSPNTTDHSLSVSFQYLNTLANTDLSGYVYAETSSSYPTFYEIVQHPSKGFVSLDAESGAFTYVPFTSQTGVDVFYYRAFNEGASSALAAVYVTIEDSLSNPVALALNNQTMYKNISQVFSLPYTSAQNSVTQGCSVSEISEDVSGDPELVITTSCSCDSAGDCSVEVKGATDFVGSAYFYFSVTVSGKVSNSAKVQVKVENSLDSVGDDAPIVGQPSNVSFDEDEDINFYFTFYDVDSAILCNSTYLTLSSSDVGIISNGATFSGTPPTCQVTIPAVANASGTADLTLSGTDLVNISSKTSTFTITRIGDDPFTEIFPFDLGSDADYTFSSSLIQLGGTGEAQLQIIDTVDDLNSPGLPDGVGHGVALKASNNLGLETSGGCDGLSSNCLHHDSSWTPQWDKIVGYYPLEGNEIDFSGNGNDGVASGMLYVANPKVGNFSGDFDGTNYINLGNIMPSSYTKMAWIRVDNAGSENIISGSSGGAQHAFWTVACGSLRLGGGHNSLWSEVCDPSTLELNQWYHVAMTYDEINGDLKLYKNGVLVDEATSHPAFSGGNDVRIGAFSSHFFQGLIDEVVIWSAALSHEEISLIYRKQSPHFAGYFLSQQFDAGEDIFWTNLKWLPQLPYGKEIPGQNVNESSSDYASLVGSTETIGDDDTFDDLVGLWHFDELTYDGNEEEVVDSSGKGNHGRSFNGADTSSLGYLNRAVIFDGQNDRLEIPAINLGSEFTISVWVQPHYLSNYGEVLSAGDTDINLTLITYASGAVQFGVADGVSWGTRASTGPGLLTEGKWSHLLVTYDGVDMELFVDGVSQDIEPRGGESLNLKLNVGFRGGLNGYFFKGAIDELAIWNRKLTNAEVSQIYHRGASDIRFQVRSCISPCTNEDFVGPDGTNQTYYSELSNQAISTPSFSLIDLDLYGRYFQYKAELLTSGNPILHPQVSSIMIGYVSEIQNNLTVPYFSYSLVSETLGALGCDEGITYQLSNNGTTWYWHNGTSWTVASTSLAESNSLASLNANIASFQDIAIGDIHFKAFLKTDGASSCDLDSLSFTGLN